MQTENLVSFRKFAGMVGASEGAVRKAIGRGSIKAGVVEVNGAKKIDPQVASTEWGKPLLAGLSENDSESPTESVVLSANRSFSQKDTDMGLGVDPDEVSIDGGDDAEDMAVSAFSKGIPENTPKPVAERLIAVFKAKRARRELEILEGKYVSADEVYKNLFEFGATLRDNIMNVPERVIDNILAADNRNEALIVLKKELVFVLEETSKLKTIKLADGVSQVRVK